MRRRGEVGILLEAAALSGRHIIAGIAVGDAPGRDMPDHARDCVADCRSTGPILRNTRRQCSDWLGRSIWLTCRMWRLGGHSPDDDGIGLASNPTQLTQPDSDDEA